MQHGINGGRNALVVLFLRNDTLLEHRGQDRVAAFLGGLGVRQWIVLDGGLNEAREERGLKIVQLRRRLGEVALRGGLHAVGDRTEGSDVEVARENLILGLGLFQRQRVLHLAELTLGGLLGRRVHLIRVALKVAAFGKRVTHVLLGDRGCALTPAVAQVRDQSTGNTRGIDAVVLVEALVLDCDDRLLHNVSDVGAGHNDALLVVEVGDHGAGRIQQLRFLSRSDRLQITGELVEDGGNRLGNERGGAGNGDEHACSDDTHERGHAQECHQQREQLGRSDSARVRVRHIPSLRGSVLIWRLATRENCLMGHA